MSFEAQSKPRRSLRDVFGKGASEDTKAITRRAAQLSMNDMAIKLGDKKQAPINETVKEKPSHVARRIPAKAAHEKLLVQVLESGVQRGRDRLKAPGVVNAKDVVIKVAGAGHHGLLFQDNVLLAVSKDSILDSSVRTAGYEVHHKFNRTPSNTRDALHTQVEAAIRHAELRGLDISNVTITVGAKKHDSGRTVNITIGPNSNEDIAPYRAAQPMVLRPYTRDESRPKTGVSGRRRKRTI